MDAIDVRFYLSILLRRLPYLLAIASLSTVIALAIALLLPRSYQSTAKILVEAPQIPANLVRSTVSTSSLEQLQIIQQQITTRDNLVALAGKLDVYGNDKDKPSIDGLVKDMRSRIAFEELPLGNGGEATVFSVAFEAGTATLAAKAANELASMILMSNQRQRTDRAGDTLQFFNDEVTRLDSELERIEADVLKFKTENKDTLPESLEFRRQQQSSQQERLISLGREEADLRTRRSMLVDNFMITGQVASAGPISAEQQMLLDLNRALSEQLAIFSENSPNIRGLRARIESLRAKSVSNGVSAVDKKVPSGLDLQLADIDKRLQFIQRERAALTQTIGGLTRSVSATPATETGLNALERNLVNIQTQYNTAIARRAEASLGKQIEVRADGGRFSLLEPATPPENPLRSRRRMIVMAGAMGGIALGLAFIALMEMLNRTIRRPSELANLLQRQPLAIIPYIAPAEDAAPSRGMLHAAGWRGALKRG
ncbi:Wzz/FepE/Etk N-terminal domain-containing protein [Rhizobium sp. Root1220]|uniref:GumC family protein n=1 Tax=Rhizobium sp. Root1220 TaxID=1736432 RepID=UPI0006F31661|nr:Wzz/FepE/Etk N-terminal domain-containing protein [Rhizobium sp. Root1220]KQV70303.1 lipopolysaccharide biosynthesis protein [Rhizobium sp. Root1220]